jgi:RNA polymerase sigma factor (sigma-70 family)
MIDHCLLKEFDSRLQSALPGIAARQGRLGARTVDDRTVDLLAMWRQGDQGAAAELFHRYAARLVALARSRISGKLAQRVDPEDVVQSAYRSFFADTRAGRYDLERGGDLWQLLVTITLHKINDQVKRNTADKRSVDREQTFGSEDSLVNRMGQAAAAEPSPMEAIALVDQVEAVMRRLEPLERRVLELRLQGLDLEEIATDVRRTQRTVRRVLDRIKELLSGKAPEPA